MPLSEGTIQVYTGNGKGKTTAALGQALRACGHGLSALMIQFMKGSANYGEVIVAPSIPNFRIVQSGLPTFVKKFAPSEEDLRLAREGLDLARKAIEEASCDVLILDEINVAMDYDLVKVEDVLDLLKLRPPHMEIILTGRYAPAEILEVAHLVTEMREVRHHYGAGKEMREGIEY
ncbi:MAG: cob(I)yrinic acid a,c-diamide adenosyltransferase [Candidatus Eisenbacteria bacterium]